MTSDVRPITILHLSDLHFGPHHRFGRLGLPTPDDTFDSLLTRLTDDLQGIETQCGRPDLVPVTGDITERAKPGEPGEFKDAFDFLVGLSEHLELGHDRVVLVPGEP